MSATVEIFPHRTPLDVAVMLVEHALAAPPGTQRQVRLVSALRAIERAVGEEAFLDTLLAFNDRYYPIK